jgi:hypothetical protein
MAITNKNIILTEILQAHEKTKKKPISYFFSFVSANHSHKPPSNERAVRLSLPFSDVSLMQPKQSNKGQ